MAACAQKQTLFYSVVKRIVDCVLVEPVRFTASVYSISDCFISKYLDSYHRTKKGEC